MTPLAITSSHPLESIPNKAESSSTSEHAAVLLMWPNSVKKVFSSADFTELSRTTNLLSTEPIGEDCFVNRSDLLEQAEVAFTSWGAPVFDEKFLKAAPRLRAVFHCAGGIRNHVTNAFWNRNITISTAVSSNAIPVAEYSFACIIFGLKGVLARAAEQRAPGAVWWGQVESPGAYRSTVGLISLGTIGRLVLERLRTLDVNVIVYDPYLTQSDARALGVELANLTELFARSDAVSLHAPHLPETTNLIRGHHLEKLKRGASFINTARGAVVNETELAAVLRKRPDIQAFIDVTNPEPPVSDSPFRSLPNVLLTPHLAGSHGRECQRLGRSMLDEYARWKNNQPLHHSLTAERVAIMG